MAQKLRVGVIGTGFGATVQIPAFCANSRIQVVAVASGQQGKARKVADEFGIRYAFDDYTELVAADLDLVSITAPPYLHHAMTMVATSTGRHVLCEKPMALSLAEAEEMLAAADRARVIHVIDHQLRFNPNRRKARALIAQGFIGQPRHALVTQVLTRRAGPDEVWTWWNDANRGGGLLGALGSHQIDLLRYWFGEIQSVSGAVEVYVKELPTVDPQSSRPVTAEDFTMFSLRFASGVVATVVLSAVAAHPGGPRLEVWGDEGTLLLDETDRLWGATRGRDFEDISEPETLSPPPGMHYVSLWGLSFMRLADHLATAILDQGPVAPAATLEDGLAVQRVMDAVRRVARSAWTQLGQFHP